MQSSMTLNEVTLFQLCNAYQFDCHKIHRHLMLSIDRMTLMLSRLRHGLAKKDWVLVTESAHALAGQGLTLGAYRLGALCRELQMFAQAEEDQKVRVEDSYNSAKGHIARMVHAVTQELQLVDAALDEHLGKNDFSEWIQRAGVSETGVTM